MASFAKLDSENKVIEVHSVVNEVLHDANGVEQESIGIEFLRNLFNEPDAVWKQTSYNTFGGTHYLGGTPFRKNHASIGFTYDADRDAFIPPKPFSSWVFNEDTCRWDPPTPYPDDKENMYIYNDETQSWDLQE